MSQAHLDEAYQLIKAGRKQEAISLVEPLIRADRNNEDAWWLLANATDDPAAKRNALNNVLRIGSTPTREDKARQMLDILEGYEESAIFAEAEDEEYNFVEQTPKRQTSPSRDYASPKRSSGCATVAKTLAVVFACIGVFVCIGCFALFGTIQNLVTVPDNYELIGTIEKNQTREGLASFSAPDAFHYTGTVGEEVSFHLGGKNTPMIAIPYRPDGTMAIEDLVNLNLSDDKETIQTTIRISQTGEYLILVWVFNDEAEQAYTIAAR